MLSTGMILSAMLETIEMSCIFFVFYFDFIVILICSFLYMFESNEI